MAQFDFGNLSSPLSGAALIDDNLEPWRDALHSSHAGTSAPSYVVSGMLWVDTATTPWVIKMYDGASHIALGNLDATAHTFKPSLASLSGDVTNAMLASMNANTVKVRAASSSGAASDLSMGASTFLARLAAGDIVAASVSQAKTLLAISFSDVSGTLGTTVGGTNLTSYTAGDIIYASATNVLSKLAKGTALQKLRMNAGATAPEWADDTGAGSGGATISTSSSSITLTNSSDKALLWNCTTANLHVKLPDATTISQEGFPIFMVKNIGTQMFVVIDAGGQAIAILKPGESAMIALGDNSTAKGKWYAGNADTVFGGAVGLSAVGESSGTAGYTSTAAYISDQKFLFGWVRSSGSFRVAVVTITDAGTLSVGSNVQVVSAASMGAHIAMVGLDASNVAVAYGYTSVNSIVVVGISGTTATVGTPTSVVTTTPGNLHLFKISSTSVFYGFVTSTTSKGVVISGMSTSGNTVGSITTCRASATSAQYLSISEAVAGSTYIYATVGTTSYLDFQLVTVSGTTVTANTAIANNSDSVAVTRVSVVALSPTVYLCAYGITNSLMMTVVRNSTGTTLERAIDGGKTVDSVPMSKVGPVVVNLGQDANSLRGWILLPNYAILLASMTVSGAGATAYLTKIYFKYSADSGDVSYVRRETEVYTGNTGYLYSDFPGAPQMCPKVSEGKYALVGTNVTSYYPSVVIYHGITPPV